MRKAVASVLLIGLALSAGCFGAFRQGGQSRTGQDIQRIGEEAEWLVDYMEGRLAVAEDSRLLELHKGLLAETNFDARRQRIALLKAQGCLAENNKGRLELRACEGLSTAADRNEAQQLLADENKDRKTVYKRIAEGHKDGRISVSRVERIYVLKRLSHAAPGQVFQLPREEEDLEALRAMGVIQRLGGHGAGDAWVIIP